MSFLYIVLYLIFVFIFALLMSWIVLKLGNFSPRGVFILIFLVVVLPSMAGYFYMAYVDSLPETVVPDVKGIALDQAKEKIEAHDLRARLAGSVYEMKYPEGYVVSQRPESGRRVKIGRVVNLMVSSGKRKVTTPNLLGRPLFQADEVLFAEGLQVGEIKRELNAGVPEGSILAQEPLPGEEVDTGRRVDLVVATTMEVKVEKATEEAE